MYHRIQRVILALWLGLGLYLVSQSPKAPQPFPDERMGASREANNPLFTAALNTSLRDYWQKPDQVLESLGELEGLTVADIGCGEGYFTLPLLEKVGPTGRVYATDIRAEVLDALRAKIPEEQRDRAKLIHITGTDTGIPTKVDLILLVQVFGEIENPDSFLDSLVAIMNPGTRLVMIDSKHITDSTSGFTRPRNLAALQHRLASHGLVFHPDYPVDVYDFLPKQFFFVLKRAN